jgi:hypothetical protein
MLSKPGLGKFSIKDGGHLKVKFILSLIVLRRACSLAKDEDCT